MTATPILIYERLPVTCEPHDPDSTTAARLVADLIVSIDQLLSVEHIGSTSVPGCPGKGVIDLQLLYPPGRLEPAKHALKKLGFQKQTTREAFPESRPMRTGALDYQGKTYRLHVHVIEAGSTEAECNRRFRDALRADPGLVTAYIAQKKKLLAAGLTDGIDYAKAKGQFVEGVLKDLGLSLTG